MPILDAHHFDFFSRSPEQTRRIGARLGRHLAVGDTLCLAGQLGSGKTTFVQGVAQGWGALDQVSSPTFVIVNEYRRADAAVMFHMDAYRLDSARSASELDLDGMLLRGPLLIEWPERIDVALPREQLRIDIAFVADESRQLQFLAVGDRYDVMIESLQQSMFGAS